MTETRPAPLAPVSWGELLDKITILEIKAERIANPAARANVARELSLLRETAAELRRLEAIFTLYRAESELSRLNRDGYLLAPSPEMLAALDLAGRVHVATGGRFDPTVQPLWRAYAAGDAQAIAAARRAR